MQKHGTLGNAGRAAGVLQERDVIVAERNALELAPTPLAERRRQAHCRGDLPRRNHFLDVAQHEIHRDALEPELLADAGDDHLPDLGLADDVLHAVPRFAGREVARCIAVVHLLPAI